MSYVTTDPTLAPAEITWAEGVNPESAAGEVIDILQNLHKVLSTRHPEYETQVRDEIALVRHFACRFASFTTPCEYASAGLAQELYRLGSLHEELDECEAEAAQIVWQVVAAANGYINVGRI